MHALFPQRPIHLADWLDTLPPRDRWETVPVRELYCDESLWSDLFETQLEATAAAKNPWVNEELKLAASIGKPILPLVTGRVELPSLLERLALLNLDTNGNLRDLTEQSEDGTEPGLDLAVQNINRVLAQLLKDRLNTPRASAEVGSSSPSDTPRSGTTS